MTGENTHPATGGGPGSGWRAAGLVGLAVLLATVVYGGAFGGGQKSDGKVQPVPTPGKEPSGVGGLGLFSSWPKDAKPDVAIVLSGQSFGFLQPCGCSRPQMGGFERRANFIDGLRKKGWPVFGADLGDLYPDRHEIGPSKIVPPTDQALLKYATAMTALRDMGYVAVGVGKTEFNGRLLNVVAEYALQKERPPFSLAGNVVGLADGKPVPRETFFPPAQGGTRPLVGLVEVADLGGIAVGVVGVVGPTLATEAQKGDPLLGFLGNKDVLATAVQGLAAHPKKPPLAVLLYQGTTEEAKKVAADWPQFQVVLCQADDSEPPQFPEIVAQAGGRKTLVVQVGHKGRYVGVVGAFKAADGSFDLKYQLVPLGEEYLTPDDRAAEKASKVLPVLEEYARQVRDRNFLAKVPRAPHPAQIQAQKSNLSFVGSAKCMGSTPGEFKKWEGTPHGHALDTLEKVAKRPGLRHLDGECAVCHTVGLGFHTGFENAEKTPELKHVGCESCHGPGSGHMSAPRAPELLKLLSPWKPNPPDKLPDAATMDKLAKLNPAERGQVVIPAAQQRVINGVSQMCMKCHDGENDPHFDLFKYWPKVVHSGLAAGGVVPK